MLMLQSWPHLWLPCLPSYPSRTSGGNGWRGGSRAHLPNLEGLGHVSPTCNHVRWCFFIKNHPELWGRFEAILMSIFFKWVEKNHQAENCFKSFLQMTQVGFPSHVFLVKPRWDQKGIPIGSMGRTVYLHIFTYTWISWMVDFYGTCNMYR